MATVFVQSCPTCRRSYSSAERVCPIDGTALAAFDSSDEKTHPAVMPPTDPLIGTVIGGRHSVLARVGAGGMGIVYRGVQQGLERPVALKILSPRFNVEDRAPERFRTEARAASLLTSPHSVKVYDFGSMDDGSLYLAMQFVEGEPLNKRISRGRLPLMDALEIAGQICDSLAEAHGRVPAIIHRDIKPDNIMVQTEPDGKPFAVVLDFGLARFADSQRLTLTNTAIGTPAYMSPEQARGSPDVDFRADLYALGIVLFEMTTGVRPFSAPDAAGLLFKHAFDAPPLMKEVLPTLNAPDGLQKLVSELLAKAPADRPASAAVVRRRLLNLKKELSLGRTVMADDKHPVVQPAATSAFPEVEADFSTEDSAPATKPKKPKWPFAVGVGVIAILIAALAIHWSTRPLVPARIEPPPVAVTAPPPVIVAPPPPVEAVAAPPRIDPPPVKQASSTQPHRHAASSSAHKPAEQKTGLTREQEKSLMVQ